MRQTRLSGIVRGNDASRILAEVDLPGPVALIGTLVPVENQAVLVRFRGERFGAFSFSFEPFEISSVVLPENFNASLTKQELEELEKIFFIDDRLLAGEEVGNTTHILTHKVVVTHMQEEEAPGGASLGGSTDDDGNPVTSPDLAPTGKLIVTLALDAPTVERVVFTQEYGTIWLAAEPSNASEDDTKLVTRANVFEDE